MKDVLLAVARKTGMLASVRSLTENFKVEDTSKLAWKFECEDEIRGTPLVQDGILYAGRTTTTCTPSMPIRAPSSGNIPPMAE
ncbi:MAG: hypothetical protein IPN59_12700 [Holophaga sp.]|nr:hypothetical protein [Holophaga sp.]